MSPSRIFAQGFLIGLLVMLVPAMLLGYVIAQRGHATLLYRQALDALKAMTALAEHLAKRKD